MQSGKYLQKLKRKEKHVHRDVNSWGRVTYEINVRTQVPHEHIIYITSLAFEKKNLSRESATGFLPLCHVFTLQQFFLNDFLKRRINLFCLYRVFTLYSNSKNNI
jgi:hypothetical protein